VVRASGGSRSICTVGMSAAGRAEAGVAVTRPNRPAAAAAPTTRRVAMAPVRPLLIEARRVLPALAKPVEYTGKP